MQEWKSRKWTRPTTFLIGVIVIGLQARFVTAQSASTESAGDIEPQTTGIASRMSIADLRLIEIHRQNHDKNPGPIVHYFHKPLFILETTANPFSGYPNIVVVKPRDIGSKTYLTFQIILTTPLFQEQARAFVIAKDPDLKVPGKPSRRERHPSGRLANTHFERQGRRAVNGKGNWEAGFLLPLQLHRQYYPYRLGLTDRP